MYQLVNDPIQPWNWVYALTVPSLAIFGMKAVLPLAMLDL